MTNDNGRDAERLPAVEAALTQIQHIAHDGLVDVETGTTYYVRYLKATDLLRKIQGIAEGGEADPEFLRDVLGFLACGRCGKPGCDPTLERRPGEGVICDECRDAEGEPAYTVVGRYGDGQTYITTVYTHEADSVPALARRACSEESEIPLNELDLEIVAVFDGEPEVIARGDETQL